jgi:hypothetical protein
VPVAGHGTPRQYAEQLAAIANPVARVDPVVEALIRRMVAELEHLDEITRDSLAQLIAGEPGYVPLLGSVVGLSQERLKRQLEAQTGSAAWIQRSRTEPLVIVDLLDAQFGLVNQLAQAMGRTYTLADILIARAARGAGASGAIDAGRQLEDTVEGVLQELNLPYQARTRYEGTARQTGPADFAVPAGGAACRIAIGVKGFDSTGSKLTAAYDEVRRMADVRRPDQYIFAIVDGVGWRGRMGDLGRLVEMVRNREIDGMFTLAEFDVFRSALRDAAVRVGLLTP